MLNKRICLWKIGNISSVLVSQRETHERMRYSYNKNTRSIKSRSALRTICIAHSGEQFIKIQISGLTFEYSMAGINPFQSYLKWRNAEVQIIRKERDRQRRRVRSTPIEKQYPLSGTSCSSDHPTRFTHSRFLIPETHSIRRLRAQNALVAQDFLVRRLALGRRGNYRQNVNMHYVAVSSSTRIWHPSPWLS